MKNVIPQKLIEKGRYWTKAWSLVEGCTPLKPACDNCWLAAAKIAKAYKTIFPAHGQDFGLVTANGHFNGKVRIREDRLNIPLKTRKPQVFAVWSDICHPHVAEYFVLSALSKTQVYQKHIYLFLTKRAERLAKIYDSSKEHSAWTAHNVFFGITVENQEQADSRIPELLKVPGKKFLSVEPMMGSLDIRKYLYPSECQRCCGGECADCGHERRPISQVICGGETGRNARPMHPDWVRSLRDQCAEAGVPFFFKGFGGRKKDRLLDGRTHDELVWNE